jgi:pimeloyl-ACP methyl ester carboxylesterase
VRDRAFKFGTDQILAGILTEPDASRLRRGAPVVVVSNVGLNHHVGPFRQWVDLSRRLAREGFMTLRFDVAGLGDSEPRKDRRSDLERAAFDMEEAIDFVVKKTGVERVVVISHCSGVDPAHTVARKDARVAGAVFIDGYAYRTWQFMIRRYTVRLLNPDVWRRGVDRRVRKYFGASERRGVGEAEEEIYQREYPTPAQLRADLSAMLARGVDLSFIYTGAFDITFSYRTQFFHMLGLDEGKTKIDVKFYRDADHVFTYLADRACLLADLTAWLSARYPA